MISATTQTLLGIAFPDKQLPKQVSVIQLDLQTHFTSLVHRISDLQTQSDTEIKKWRHLYKKANKKLKQTAGFQDTISQMYDQSQS